MRNDQLGTSTSGARRPPVLTRLLAAVALLHAGTGMAATLFINASVHPVSGAAIANGQMLIDGDKIVAVGADLSSQAGSARVVDLQGRWLVPAFISANTVMGLTEIETVRGTVDIAEAGGVNPNARAEVAVNPDSELYGVARANGVLYAHVVPQPGQGGVIGGSSALLQLEGWTWEDMTVQAPVGVHLYWPSARMPDWLPAPMRAEAIKGVSRSREMIEQAFKDADAYRSAKSAGTLSQTDARWEAMIPVLDGSRRLFIHAVALKEIREALDFTRDRGLDVVLVGAQDGWRVAEELRARQIPVILHAPWELPLRRHEGHNTNYANAARLAQAGVAIAIASQANSFNATLERNLPHAAAQAVAFGLPWEQGLHAITLAPAQFLGVADRLGSLEAGKQASFLIADGDPLEVRSRIVEAWIDGEPLDLSSRHTRLRDKYQRKYQQP